MRVVTLFAVALTLTLGACGDDEGAGAVADSGVAVDSAGGDLGAPADAAGRVDSGATVPTLSTVYETVISQKCAPCHTAAASGGLSMSDRATAYDNLVGQAAAGSACGSSGLERVAAGDSAGSLIVQKLEGTQGCGSAMPQGRPALAEDEIALIKRWIEGGAKDD